VEGLAAAECIPPLTTRCSKALGPDQAEEVSIRRLLLGRDGTPPDQAACHDLVADDLEVEAEEGSAALAISSKQ
jgi:hypothetical protein